MSVLFIILSFSGKCCAMVFCARLTVLQAGYMTLETVPRQALYVCYPIKCSIFCQYFCYSETSYIFYKAISYFLTVFEPIQCIQRYGFFHTKLSCPFTAFSSLHILQSTSLPSRPINVPLPMTFCSL